MTATLILPAHLAIESQRNLQIAGGCHPTTAYVGPKQHEQLRELFRFPANAVVTEFLNLKIKRLPMNGVIVI